MTQSQIVRKVIWFRRLINELNIDETLIINTSISINIDNQSAIALSKNFKFHSRTKHIDIQ